jgi:hypothetical protein
LPRIFSNREDPCPLKAISNRPRAFCGPARTHIGLFHPGGEQPRAGARTSHPASGWTSRFQASRSVSPPQDHEQHRWQGRRHGPTEQREYEQTEPLSGVFYLASALTYLPARRAGGKIGASIAFPITPRWREPCGRGRPARKPRVSLVFPASGGADSDRVYSQVARGIAPRLQDGLSACFRECVPAARHPRTQA